MKYKLDSSLKMQFAFYPIDIQKKLGKLSTGENKQVEVNRHIRVNISG